MWPTVALEYGLQELQAHILIARWLERKREFSHSDPVLEIQEKDSDHPNLTHIPLRLVFLFECFAFCLLCERSSVICLVILSSLLIFEREGLKTWLKPPHTQVELSHCELHLKVDLAGPFSGRTSAVHIFRSFPLGWSDSPEKILWVSCLEVSNCQCFETRVTNSSWFIQDCPGFKTESPYPGNAYHPRKIEMVAQAMPLFWELTSERELGELIILHVHIQVIHCFHYGTPPP